MKLFLYIKKIDDYFKEKEHAELFFKLIILMMLLLLPLMAVVVIKTMGDRTILAAKISSKNYTMNVSECAYSFSPTTISASGLVQVKVTQGSANHRYLVGITTGNGQLISTATKIGTPPLIINLKAPNVAGSYLVVVRDDSTKTLCGGSPSLTVVDGNNLLNCRYDLNKDGAVTDSDVQIVLKYFGLVNANYDFTGDGVVDISDALVVSQAIGTSCPKATPTPTPIVKQPSPSPLPQ